MHEEVILSRREGRVGIIQLNRPAQLNALTDQLMDALGATLLEMDREDGIGCIVLLGHAKAFAAGADIEAMKNADFAQVLHSNFITRNWETILRVRKPVIAAVRGYALGAGCELAMMCDLIIAGDDAKFGQPEIKLAIIPGAGGTQRLPRAISKAKAMDMVLTARMMDAAEAERAGLVSRVVPAQQVEDEALAVALTIASMSLPSVMAAKESVNRAYESSLTEGVLFERKCFHSMFATLDQKEGMAAFVERRKPEFTHR